MKLLLAIVFAAVAFGDPVAKGTNVSLESARQLTGVPFPDQYIVSVSHLDGAYKSVRVTVRYADRGGSGQFIAIADVVNGSASLGFPISGADSFSATDIWVDYGNTTRGYDFPQTSGCQ